MENHTQISKIVLISKLLKIAQQIIVMFCLSYFTGLIWYVFCSYAKDNDSEGFIEAFEFDIKY